MTILADRYELIEKVGAGGMGVVWRAHDTRLERDVAIKLLRSFVADERDQRRRLAREARTLAGLSNDHIVRVFDYVEAGDDTFLVMEFIEGGNLAAATVDRLPLPWGEAAFYAAPVCEALAYAHAKGVVHRDLTPANILIERETGRVVATDFGLARIARSAGSITTLGVLVGTPEYWSPEQAMGRESDSASDMYALGCILYQLLAGRLPFEGDDRLAVGLRRAHEDPPRLRGGVPRAAAALVEALLRREPARRPDAGTAAAAFAAAARQGVPRAAARRARAAEAPTPVLSTPAIEAPTVRISSTSTSTSVARRRRRRLVTACIAAAVAAFVGVVVAADRLFDRGVRTPNVVRLPENVARARLLGTVPTATVSVVRVYSTRIAFDRVIRQRPAARTKLGSGARVTLTVSKGSPFAAVPAVRVGVLPAAARADLARHGFGGRYRFTPSWWVRKGTVIELRPQAGTRLHRPATVLIVIASGYPREVVPDVQDTDLGSAQTRLGAKHLGYQIVYRRSWTAPPNRVVAQMPRAGATVYRGTRVRLTVTRTPRWWEGLSLQ